MTDGARELLAEAADYLVNVKCPAYQRQRRSNLLTRITALLSENADGDARDAERFRKVQNMPAIEAQALFWNIQSRRQRAAAIDKLPAHPLRKENDECLDSSFYIRYGGPSNPNYFSKPTALRGRTNKNERSTGKQGIVG